MKKEYNSPEIKVTSLSNEDIITVSAVTGTPQGKSGFGTITASQLGL